MATLADKINKNKSMLKRGGGLFEATGETIMSRLKKADMIPGAGTSPLAASAIGAGPDQAKMAGSAAQLQKSIKDTLAKEEKKEPRGLRSILTEEEADRKDKAEKLNNLELLGSRIGGIVNNIIDKANVAIPYELDIQEDVIKADFPELTDENRNSFESILAEITFDENGNPIITEDMLGRANALLPEDKKLESIEDLKKYVVGATIGTLQVNTTKLKETYPDITEEQIAAVKGILTKAGLTEGGKPEDMPAEDLNEVAKLLGITAETRETIIAKIKEFITPVTQTVVDNITDTLGPTVSLSDFKEEDWQAFGLTGPSDLVGLLGITKAEASELTVGELQEKVNALLQADYDRVEELTRVANDPFYPENLRKAAQAELRDLSSVGVMATESDFEKLNEAVQSADEIEVAGKTYTVDELLSDEQLTVLISAYLEDPESDFSKELARDLPELEAFITENKVALEAAMKYLDESIQEKIATAKKNDAANIYAPKEGVKVDLSGVNKAILGDEYEGGVFVDEAIPEGAFTKGEGDDAVTYYHQENLRSSASVFSDDDKVTYANTIATAQKEGYTALFQELVTMDSRMIETTANNLGINISQWINRKYTQAVNNKQISEAIASKNVQDQRLAIESIFGGKDKLSKLIKSAKEAKIFQDDEYGTLSKDAKELLDNFVFNADGSLNYSATLTVLQKTNLTDNTLKEAGLKSLINDTDITSKKYNALWKLTRDGTFTYDEAISILNAGDDNIIEKMATIYANTEFAQGKTKVKYPDLVDKWATEKVTEQFNSTELAKTLKGIFNVDKVRFSSKDGVYGLDSLAEGVRFRWKNVTYRPSDSSSFAVKAQRIQSFIDTTWKPAEDAKAQLEQILTKLAAMKIGKSLVIQQKISDMEAIYQSSINSLNSKLAEWQTAMDDNMAQDDED